MVGVPSSFVFVIIGVMRSFAAVQQCMTVIRPIYPPLDYSSKTEIFPDKRRCRRNRKTKRCREHYLLRRLLLRTDRLRIFERFLGRNTVALPGSVASMPMTRRYIAGCARIITDARRVK